MSPAPVLGVVVPCRNEAGVVARKLANLAPTVGVWPAAPRPHRLLVVDDESEDHTADLAREALCAWPDDGVVRAEVLRNDRRPGKAGAIACALARLADTVDVIVLTDADVVVRPGSLAALARVLGEPDGPGMACGSQEFVVDLCDDGRPLGADGGPPRAAAGLYDRVTAVVRALESRGGRLFSVHGQLLAWRAELDLQPSPGVAADDLDLMRQVRAAGRRVVKLDDARFLEVKTPAGPARRDQELRRAQAYFGVIGRCRLPPGASWTDRLHFALYRRLPGAAPWLAMVGVVALPLLAMWRWGPLAAGACAALAVALALSPAGRRLVRLLGVIARSRLAEARAPSSDRWEMTRR